MNAAHADRAATGPPRPWRRGGDHSTRQQLVLIRGPRVVAVPALSGAIADGASSAPSGPEQPRRLVAAGRVASELAAERGNERAIAALVFAQRPSLSAIGACVQQASGTDPVATRFTATLAGSQVPARLEPLLQRLRDQLSGPGLQREQAHGGRDTTASVLVSRYRAVVADLVSHQRATSQLGIGADSADGLPTSATVSPALNAVELLQVNVPPGDTKPTDLSRSNRNAHNPNDHVMNWPPDGSQRRPSIKDGRTSVDCLQAARRPGSAAMRWLEVLAWQTGQRVRMAAIA